MIACEAECVTDRPPAHAGGSDFAACRYVGHFGEASFYAVRGGVATVGVMGGTERQAFPHIMAASRKKNRAAEQFGAVVSIRL